MTDFLGTGWAFPPRVDARGRIMLARQERDVEEAIRMILLTPKGQRVMRRIIDLFMEEGGSTSAVARRMNEEQHLSLTPRKKGEKTKRPWRRAHRG